MATKKSTSTSKKSTTKKSTSTRSKSSYSQPTITNKKVVKYAKKAAKENPKGFLITVIIVIIFALLAIGGYVVYKKLNPDHTFRLNGAAVTSLKLNEGVYEEKGAVATYGDLDVSDKIEITIHENSKSGNTVTSITVDELKTFYVEYSINYEKLNEKLYRQVNVVEIDSMAIHFLELGNYNTGDSTYIKAGDTDILIDAGSRKNSALTIYNYLTQPGNIEDNTIEYLIVTHAHEDHIAALVGSSGNGILDKFTIKNIIQFSNTGVTSNLYAEYQNKVNALVQGGTKLYKAGDLVEGHNTTFDIALGTQMKILDQKYYRETSSSENNYSVCTLFTHGDSNYLFTGDLEKAGEQSLVELNSLPHCELFKGGHHGSATSNNDVLLDQITPEVVCICCCAGNDEYSPTKNNQFPYQETINRLAKHTEKIYVTSVTTDGHQGFTSMNGNIVFTSLNGSTYEVHGSNNDTILKETSWFKANRTWPTI